MKSGDVGRPSQPPQFRDRGPTPDYRCASKVAPTNMPRPLAHLDECPQRDAPTSICSSPLPLRLPDELYVKIEVILVVHYGNRAGLCSRPRGLKGCLVRFELDQSRHGPPLRPLHRSSSSRRSYRLVAVFGMGLIVDIRRAKADVRLTPKLTSETRTVMSAA